jgi:hypothetical protein
VGVHVIRRVVAVVPEAHELLVLAVDRLMRTAIELEDDPVAARCRSAREARLTPQLAAERRPS